MRVVEDLPLVPTTWIASKRRCGEPSAVIIRRIRSRPKRMPNSSSERRWRSACSCAPASRASPLRRRPPRAERGASSRPSPASLACLQVLHAGIAAWSVSGAGAACRRRCAARAAPVPSPLRSTLRTRPRSSSRSLDAEPRQPALRFAHQPHQARAVLVREPPPAAVEDASRPADSAAHGTLLARSIALLPPLRLRHRSRHGRDGSWNAQADSSRSERGVGLFGRGFGDERRREALLDGLLRDDALLHVAARGQLELHLEQDLLDDRAQTARAGFALEALLGDRRRASPRRRRARSRRRRRSAGTA